MLRDIKYSSNSNYSSNDFLNKYINNQNKRNVMQKIALHYFLLINKNLNSIYNSSSFNTSPPKYSNNFLCFGGVYDA